MRYVAKIHIMDVMDQVIVSGYVFDADPLSDPDHVAIDFSEQMPGRGIDDPLTWLLVHVGQAILQMTKPGSRKVEPGSAEGAPYTLYETGDTGQ